MYADNGGKVICAHHIEGDFFALNAILFYKIEWLLYDFVTVM